MKKLVRKISVYKVIEPYTNWYSIKTDDSFNRDNIIIVGKKQLLKVASSLIMMALFDKRTTIKIYKSDNK